jgi:hypothetical protein
MISLVAYSRTADKPCRVFRRALSSDEDPINDDINAKAKERYTEDL